MKELNLALFDIVLLIVVLLGLLRGRKRGMSHELLDMLQWVAIIVGAALFYPLVGNLLIRYAGLPPFISNVFGYILGMLIVIAIFRTIKNAVGEKVAQGDMFGRMEFYLGMLGGGIRFFCVLLFIISILHAKYSTAESRAANAKMQQDNFGSISLPTIDSLQQMVFYKSTTGGFIRTNLSMLLVQPQPSGPGRQREGIGRKRERAVEEVMTK